jgi:hypothetical protein
MKKIAAVNFQNQCAPGTNRAPVIIECGFVSGADLTQYSARSFDYLANSKTAPDLNDLAARNDDFVFRTAHPDHGGQAEAAPYHSLPQEW